MSNLDMHETPLALRGSHSRRRRWRLACTRSSVRAHLACSIDLHGDGPKPLKDGVACGGVGAGDAALDDDVVRVVGRAYPNRLPRPQAHAPLK